MPSSQEADTPATANGYVEANARGSGISLAETLGRHGIEFREQPPDDNGVTWYHVRNSARSTMTGAPSSAASDRNYPTAHFAGHCFHPEGTGQVLARLEVRTQPQFRQTRRVSIVQWPSPHDRRLRPSSPRHRLRFLGALSPSPMTALRPCSSMAVRVAEVSTLRRHSDQLKIEPLSASRPQGTTRPRRQLHEVVQRPDKSPLAGQTAHRRGRGHARPRTTTAAASSRHCRRPGLR